MIFIFIKNKQSTENNKNKIEEYSKGIAETKKAAYGDFIATGMLTNN